jgi:enterochelin esterase family protein
MLIESDEDPRYRRVTFTWTDPDPERPAADVLLRLHTLTDKARADRDLTPYLMARDPSGTWTLSIRLRADFRAAYQFCPSPSPLRGRTFPEGEEADWLDLMGRGVADPANPAVFGAIWANPGPTSLLELPDAIPQPWVQRAPGTPEGETAEHEFPSEVLGKPRRVWVYTPASDFAADFAVAVMLDGDDWYADFPSTLDNLIAKGLIPPIVALMIDAVDGETRTAEFTAHARYLRFLVDELLPWAERRWKITRDPGRTVVAGQSLGGLFSAYAGLHAPHRFGRVLSQSGSYWWPSGSEFDVDAGVITREFVHMPRQPIRIWMEAGLVEWTLRDQNRHLRDVLYAKGYDLAYREYHGGHDNACWRGGLADGLIALLGTP